MGKMRDGREKLRQVSRALVRVFPRFAASHRIGHRQDRRPRRERSQSRVCSAGLQGHRGGEHARWNVGDQAARHGQGRRTQREDKVSLSSFEGACEMKWNRDEIETRLRSSLLLFLRRTATTSWETRRNGSPRIPTPGRSSPPYRWIANRRPSII